MIVKTDVVAMWEIKQEETSNDMMPPGSPECASSLVPLSFSAAFDNQGGFQVHTQTEPSASEAGKHKSTLDYPSDIVIKQEMETAEDADCFVVDLTEVSEDEDTGGIRLTGDYKWSYGAVVKLEKENFLQIVPDTHGISDTRSKKKIETQQQRGAVRQRNMGSIVLTDAVALREIKQEQISNNMMPPSSPEGTASLVPASFALHNQGGFQVHIKTEPSAGEDEHKSTLDYPLDIVIKQEMEMVEGEDCFEDQMEVLEDEDTSGTRLTGDYKWSYGAVLKVEKENFLQIVPDTHTISDIRSKMMIETQQGAVRQRNMNSIVLTDVVALWEIKQEQISNNMMPPSSPEGATSLVPASFALDNQAGFQVHIKTEPSAGEGEHKCTLDYPLDIVIKQEMETEEGEDCFEDQQSTVDYPLDIVIKQEMEAAEDADCFVVEQVEISEDGDTSEATLTSNLKWSDSAVVKSEKESLHQNVPDTHSISDTSEEMSNSQQQAMRMHRRQEEIFQEKTDHTCSVCGKDFDESQACLWHMWQNHTVEKTYNCHICEKAFKDIESLRRHGKYHKNERPFSCDVCGSTFKRKSHVQKHVATYHPDQWPYSCDLCEKTFKQRAHVQRHLATCHPGQRPHTCDLCEEIFKEKADVHLHIAIYHPGERPFSCDVCEKTFKRKAHLREHKTSFHHIEKPFS